MIRRSVIIRLALSVRPAFCPPRLEFSDCMGIFIPRKTDCNQELIFATM